MRRTGLAAVFVVFSVFASAIAVGSAAHAQSASPACARLEGQLAALGAGSGAAGGQALRQAAVRQRAELDRMLVESRSLNCERRIFIFGPTPAPQCTDLLKRIGKARVDVDRLNAQAAQAQSGNDPMRRQLIGALAQNNCGPQYRTAGIPVQRRQAGLLGMLFGGEASEDPGIGQVPEAPVAAAPPRSSTFRTVCVRSCDGFFFPISYTTGTGAFSRDEEICRVTCPGTEARLFAYPNPGGAIEQAVSATGEPYSQMPNAFRYKTEFVSGCSCKPAGMSWSDALSGVDDRTLRKGDIVVDEARSQAMANPKLGLPPVAPAPVQQAAPPVQQAAPRTYLEPPPEASPDPGRRMPGEMILTPNMEP